MADAAVAKKPETETERELTDGFHLVIDALKLNGIKTIYGGSISRPPTAIRWCGMNSARSSPTCR